MTDVMRKPIPSASIVQMVTTNHEPIILLAVQSINLTIP